MQKLAVQAEKLLQTKTPTKLQQLEAGITKVEGALTTSSQKLQKGTQGLLASEKTIKQKTTFTLFESGSAAYKIESMRFFFASVISMPIGFWEPVRTIGFGLFCMR